eukprot:gb/GECG01006042.1/.p1 GENE.gb/GECG01006042.1/~~gb/GECG01006042.1/.p1  ORF type:complete len:633 (+),score=87.25 gb/GECG01006042.1/:1-1899(+)
MSSQSSSSNPLPTQRSATEGLYEARRQAIRKEHTPGTSDTGSHAHPQRKPHQQQQTRELPPNHPLRMRETSSSSAQGASNTTSRAPPPPRSSSASTGDSNPYPFAAAYKPSPSDSSVIPLDVDHPMERAEGFVNLCKVPPPQTKTNDPAELAEEEYPDNYYGIAKMACDNLWKDVLAKTHSDKRRGDNQACRLVRKYYRALAQLAYGEYTKASTEATGLWVWPEEGSEGGRREMEAFGQTVALNDQWMHDLKNREGMEESSVPQMRASSVPFAYRLLLASLPSHCDKSNASILMLRKLKDCSDISTLLATRDAVAAGNDKSSGSDDVPATVCWQLLGKHPFLVAIWRVRTVLSLASILVLKERNYDEAIRLLHRVADEFSTVPRKAKGQDEESRKNELWNTFLSKSQRAGCACLSLYDLARYYMNIGDIEAASQVHEATSTESERMIPSDLGNCYQLLNESLILCCQQKYEEAIDVNRQATETCKDVLQRVEQTWGAYPIDAVSSTSKSNHNEVLLLVDQEPSNETLNAFETSEATSELEHCHFSIFENLYVKLMNNRAIYLIHTGELVEAVRVLEEFVKENPRRYMKEVIMRTLLTLHKLSQDDVEVDNLKQVMQSVGMEYRLFHLPMFRK